MTKLNKVVLNEVELKNVKNVGVLHVSVKATDARKHNPGRPVNKQSARYKRLAKQAKYALALSKFTQGVKFKLNKEKSQLFSYSISSGESFGILVSAIGGYVCNIDYLGRTKATGYTFVLDKKVNVELNLKTLVFVS